MNNVIVAVHNEDILVLKESANPTAYNAAIKIIQGDTSTPIPTPPPDDGFYERGGYKYPTFLWPTENVGFVNQAFGINPDWYNKYGLPGHEGIDMRAGMNSRIRCVWDGVVSRNNSTQNTAYGWEIRVKHTINGINYESQYAHMIERPVLAVGAHVKKGDVLGFADSTGNSTGSHLHFMLKQFNGTVPPTTLQLKFKDQWAKYNLIDPTYFFKELRP